MKSWQDMLRDQFPLLYRKEITFECGIGWYDILYDLSGKIERILEDYEEVNPKSEGEGEGEEKDSDSIEIFAVQVKEKYGILRFYLSFETNEISELIEEAERLSMHTCECCGDSGEMRGDKWCVVRCDKCF